MTTLPPGKLTDLDRGTITRARELADLAGLDAIRAATGYDDPACALADVFGRAQWLLGELADLAERPE